MQPRHDTLSGRNSVRTYTASGGDAVIVVDVSTQKFHDTHFRVDAHFRESEYEIEELFPLSPYLIAMSTRDSMPS